MPKSECEAVGSSKEAARN